MAIKTIPIGDFSKGMTPAVVDKKSRGWKTLENVEHNDLIGAVTPRDGLTDCPLFSGGTTFGEDIASRTIVPSATDEAWMYTGVNTKPRLSQIGDWVTFVPELYWSIEPQQVHYVQGFDISGVYAVGTWAASNPNAKMKLTLYRANITQELYTMANGQQDTRWVYDLGAPLASDDVAIGALTSSDTTLQFRFASQVTLAPGSTYLLKVELTDLSVALSSACDIGFSSMNFTNNYQYFNFLVLQGSIKYSYVTIKNLTFSNGYVQGAIFGPNTRGGFIEDTMHVAATPSALIAVTNGPTNGPSVLASTDTQTTKNILPAAYDGSKYVPTYKLPNERYGMSMLRDGNSHIIAFLSNLMQSAGDGHILFWDDRTERGVSLANSSCVQGDIVYVGANSASNANGNQYSTVGTLLAGVFQYGVRYVYAAGASELVAGPRVRCGSKHNIITGTSEDPKTDGVAIKVQVKTVPDASNIPLGIEIYRRAVLNDYDQEDSRLDANAWKQIAYAKYTPAAAGQLAAIAGVYCTGDFPQTFTITDHTARVRADDIITINAGTTASVTVDAGQAWAYVSTQDGSAGIQVGDYFTPPGVPVSPQPCFVFNYNERTIALGDKDNKSTVYFSFDSLLDFYADNAFTLDLPPVDYFLTAGFTLGGNAYVASPHKIWRIIEVSDSLPYYKIEPVAGMDGVGIISPKTLIVVGGLAYFLSPEGFVAFNGTDKAIISGDIDNILKQIPSDYIDAAGVKVNPNEADCFYPPYLAEAVYDETRKNIYLAIPANSTDHNTRCLKYSLSTRLWSEVAIDDFRGFIQVNNNGVSIRTVNMFMGMNYKGKMDMVTSVPSDIPSTLESYDIALPQKGRVKLMTIYGTGTVNVTIYINRSSTAAVTKTAVTLKEDGTDIPINRDCFEFRYKIDAVTSDDFMLTAPPDFTIETQGQKIRGDVE